MADVGQSRPTWHFKTSCIALSLSYLSTATNNTYYPLPSYPVSALHRREAFCSMCAICDILLALFELLFRRGPTVDLSVQAEYFTVSITSSQPCFCMQSSAIAIDRISRKTSAKSALSLDGPKSGEQSKGYENCTILGWCNFTRLAVPKDTLNQR